MCDRGGMSTVELEPGVFDARHGDAVVEPLAAWYGRHGFATLRRLLDDDAIARVERECEQAQADLVAGRLDERYGTSILIEGDAGDKAVRFANYVTYVNELSPGVHDAATHPVLVAVVERLLGPKRWLLEDQRFGVVYQDARPGRESSYTRIGWHSDWQSGPNLDMWPSVAFTIHIDATSPENGFLRVVPGSHQWATPAPYDNVNGAIVPDGSARCAGYGESPPPVPMPLRFEKIAGEVALYAERGDVLLHDAYLWHSAARATDDDARRRHVRGGWYSGAGRLADGRLEQFVKNAAR
jgi:Phytanoyl-CoA dioxygenase (PhyH)